MYNKIQLIIIEQTEQLKLDRLELIENLFELKKTFSNRELAQKFGLSESQMSRIANGRLLH